MSFVKSAKKSRNSREVVASLQRGIIIGYIMATKEEIIKEQLFGPERRHKYLAEILKGDLRQELDDSISVAKLDNVYQPPPVLYRYRPMNNKDYLAKELEQLINGCRVFAADPKYFNDPYDCQPVITGNSRAHAAAMARKYTDDKVFSPDVIGSVEALLRLTNRYEDADFTKQFIEVMKMKVYDVLSSVRCACLTTRSDSAAMWYHYANKYRGVCMKFEIFGIDSDKLLRWFFSQSAHYMRAVKYEKIRPTIDCMTVFKVNLADHDENLSMIAQHDLDRLMQATYFIKSDDWNYEEEVRLINNMGNMYIPMDPYKLTQIILGPEIDEVPDVEDIVRTFCMRHGIDVVSSSKSEVDFGIRIQ